MPQRALHNIGLMSAKARLQARSSLLHAVSEQQGASPAASDGMLWRTGFDEHAKDFIRKLNS
jgi:hypothetical protein